MSLAILVASALTMQLPAAAYHLFRELAKRAPIVEASDGTELLAADLRARFDNHPKQRAFWQSTSECRRDAALTTRRAGKSDGGVHEWAAKAITVPGWRGVYVNETKPEARKIVWRNDMGQGWCDLIAKHGVVEGDGYRLGNVLAVTNETTLEINFSNGSQIALFGADDEQSINKMRGQAKDDIWVDESQKMQHLRAFVLQVASACLKDKRGRLKLTGTPSEDCAGYFYDVTPEPSSGDAPLPGWEVHRWSVTDNPWFGATDEERWARTAGEALAENGWDGTEPEFIREWLGKWVKSDARYVYPVHAVPGHVRLAYAPQRLVSNPINTAHPPWLDYHAAVADLPHAPKGHRPYTWLYAIGADFGYVQDPFALAVWATTHALPDVFELFSWKEHKVVPDDQRDYLKWLWEAMDNVVVLVGDPAGQVSANMAGWRERVGLPIDEADKSSKPTWQAMMAGDIRKGRIRYRENSPLLTEHRHLVYLPTKPGKPLKDHADRRSSDGKIHGNHCFVAGTMVATDAGPIPIEHVMVGSMVHGRTGETHPVVAAFSSGFFPTWRLILSDDSSLVGTCDHPIWTSRGWVPLENLVPGDRVEPAISVDGEVVTVASVGRTGLVECVYNLTVAEVPEFFANGILVHNCSDAGLYAYRHLTHYLHRAATPKPEPGSREAHEATAEREERRLEQREERRAQAMADGDEMVAEYGGGYGNEW